MTQMMIGMSAAICTTIAFIPQVIKIYKAKDAKEISILTFCIFSLGVFLWLIYGIMIKEWPVIIANFITLLLALMIIVMKIKYR